MRDRYTRNTPRNRIVIRCSVEIDILESLCNDGAMLRIIAHHDDFGGVDVHVVGIIEIILNGDSGRKVELRVERAGTVAGLDAGWSGELVHVGGAGGRAVQALLDAVAFVLDCGELQVNFGHHAGNVETFGVWFLCVNIVL